MTKTLVISTAAVLALGAGAATAQDAKPNDAQIAHIAYAADQIDIAAGRQALKKSPNPKVRAFAQEMVRDHTAVNKKALALVKSLRVTPRDNPTSQQLSAGAKSKLTTWLTRIALNEALIRQRAGQRRARLLRAAGTPVLADFRETP